MGYFVLAAFLLAIWAWNPSLPWSGTRTAYEAICINDAVIMAYPFALDRYGLDARKEMRRAAKECRILTSSRTEYRINRAKGEVSYVIDSSNSLPRRLVNCTIHDTDNWICEYPDFASGVYEGTRFSGRVGLLDGLPVQYEGDVHDPHYRRFYLRKWQWWAVKLLARLGWQRTGALLIPEQKAGW